MAADRVERKPVAILAADVAGYSSSSGSSSSACLGLQGVYTLRSLLP
jgi:hypothetical protein